MISTIEELLTVARAEHETAKMVESFGGFSKRKVQSDKIGYDWNETYLGEKLIVQEYAPQANPVGVADNPIEYFEGVQLINNAYYMKNGVRVVYMNGEFIEF